ncbi:MAG: NUDIX domain-containing protein [Phycisphaerae bacterium]|nr:NUDIX domain-containing protein [Phycisphaerae bacterium]
MTNRSKSSNGFDPTAAAARTIRLRRPPSLVRVSDLFVPRVALAEVDRRWQVLRAANPRFFDGSILHVLGVHRNGHGGVTIHVAPTSYRFYAVQRDGFDCGVRALGAKALCRYETRYLMAKRSASVAFYPDQWEFVPGGGLEPDDAPATCVLRELREETDFEAASPPVAVALLYDPGALSWEVIHRIDVRPSRDGDATHAWEHSQRTLVDQDAWPEPLCDVARAMTRLLA